MNEKLLLDLLELSLLKSKNKKMKVSAQRIKTVRDFHKKNLLTRSEMEHEIKSAVMFSM